VRLRVFQAPTGAAALAAVRAALGEEAVVLGTRRVAGGVEVTAALEAEEPIFILPEAEAPPPVRPELERHRLPAALAGRLSGGTLEAALAGALRFEALPEDGTLFLVGPPGAGKTLSCAKFATRAVMAGAAPVVVTADGTRAGAVEQLAAFTRLLRLPLAVAAQPDVLCKALAARRPGQGAIVDGFGCDPFDPAQAERLLRLIRAAEATPVLVLPAGLDAEESAELARAFRALGARHLLPTRLDGARRLGGVLAAAAAGLALSEAGIGPHAAGGLEAITPSNLAARLLRPALEMPA
jgi:flagellar biosynthesis protein FlhF